MMSTKTKILQKINHNAEFGIFTKTNMRSYPAHDDVVDF